MKSLARLALCFLVLALGLCSAACNMVFGLEELELRHDAGDPPRVEGGSDAHKDGAGGAGSSDASNGTDASSDAVGLDVKRDGPPTDGGSDVAADRPQGDGLQGDGSRVDADGSPVGDAPVADVSRDDADGSAVGDAPRDNGPAGQDANDVGNDVNDAADGSETGAVDMLTSIDVTPTNPSVAIGTTQQLTATGTYTVTGARNITTQVTWDSSNTSRATVGNVGATKGIVSGVALGAATMTATLGLVSGSTTVTVTVATLTSIAVTPSNSTVALGRSVTFQAMGTYSDTTMLDVTQSVNWSSNATGVTTITNTGTRGIASTVGMGMATITAMAGAVSGTTSLTVGLAVLDTLTITPANPSVKAGSTLQLSAMGTYSDNTMVNLTPNATWFAVDTPIGTVSDIPGSKGLAMGNGAGSTPISATVGGVVANETLTVTP